MAPDIHRWELLYIKHACKYSLVRPFKWKICFGSKVYENVVSRGSPLRVAAVMITGWNTHRGLGRTLGVVLHVWLWESNDSSEINDGHLSHWTDLELCTTGNGMFFFHQLYAAKLNHNALGANTFFWVIKLNCYITGLAYEYRIQCFKSFVS